MICPFKVGDRIRTKTPGFGEGPATVTAVHENGFDWELDEVKVLVARLGTSYKSGTCFPNGFDNYEKLTQTI
jgi:hypothetical protein